MNYNLTSKKLKNITIGSVGISYGHDRVANILLNHFTGQAESVEYFDAAKTPNKMEQLVWDTKRGIFMFVSGHVFVADLYTTITNPRISPRRNYHIFGPVTLPSEEKFHSDKPKSIGVSTHYSSTNKLAGKMPTISYVTDFMAHPAHVNHRAAFYAVPTERVGDDLFKNGADESKIAVTGVVLPDNLVLNSQNDYEKRVARLCGVNKRTILIAIGGGGAHTKLLDETLTLAENSNWLSSNAAIVFVGDNYRLKDHLCSKFGGMILTDNNITYGVNIIYDKSKWASFDTADKIIPQVDVLISKPDIWLHYALLGIPFVAMPPVGHQEVRNYDFARVKGLLVTHSHKEVQSLFNSNDYSYLVPIAQKGYSPGMINGVSNIQGIVNSII